MASIVGSASKAPFRLDRYSDHMDLKHCCGGPTCEVQNIYNEIFVLWRYPEPAGMPRLVQSHAVLTDSRYSGSLWTRVLKLDHDLSHHTSCKTTPADTGYPAGLMRRRPHVARRRHILAKHCLQVLSLSGSSCTVAATSSASAKPEVQDPYLASWTAQNQAQRVTPHSIIQTSIRNTRCVPIHAPRAVAPPR